jgi:hypothetical protein
MASEYTVKISADVDLTKAKAKMDEFINTYSKKTVNFGTGTSSGSGSSKSSKSGTEVFTTIGNAAKKNTGIVSSFTSELKNLSSTIPKVAAFAVATAAINAFTSAAASAINNVIELDSQLTEFRKVSDLTGDALNSFVKQAGEVGVALGKTSQLWA